MPTKKYIVTLTDAERDTLEKMTQTGKAAAYKMNHARILLKADAHQPDGGWTDVAISEALDLSVATIERIRRRFVEQGLAAALSRKSPSRHKARKLDGEQEAHLVALTCSEPPEGHCRWSLRLLAERMVMLDYVESICHETVRQTLKKTFLKPWLKQSWVIPPKANAEFVAHMEDVLEVYKQPYDPLYPQVCFDECSKQLVSEVQVPLPAEPGQPARYDYEYERQGVCNLFLFSEPLTGWRHVTVTAHRTAIDYAHQMRFRVDQWYPHALKIRLVHDQLNTHRPASLYKAFAPVEAKRILDKLEFHYTPKHGSWLNMAEIELSVLTRQCLNQRIPGSETLQREVAAWQKRWNYQNRTIDWRFTTDDARIKLKRLYPSIIP
ncbi:MAG: IS630 family transposase [Leptolyngbya sp. SIOISBB]|nr:IS630 family transposase [Leptolyngbya sp. SIOISBB]